jgi:tetratricopeptide (TPR) repeat protein
MRGLRVVGVVIAALLATGLVVRGCAPEKPQPEPPQPPPREAFHVSKPLRIAVSAKSEASDKTHDVSWLELELRQLLRRGKMNVAPADASAEGAPFLLQVEVAADAKRIALSLIAADGVTERTTSLAHEGTARLDVMNAIAAQLPQFLGAAQPHADWTVLIGTRDAKAYESFLNGLHELSGPNSRGLTQPGAASRHARTVERLEALTRRQPAFSRAWSALAAGYLSLGGKDEASLTQLAEATAERALSLDAEAAQAHAALGIVHSRRNSWVAAEEQFERALQLDANEASALEGLACLLVDAGQHEAARPLAHRALAIQPGNVGARECLAYAGKGANDTAASEPAVESAPIAHVQALRAILGGNFGEAQRLLRGSLSRQDFEQWAAPLLRAAADRRHTTDALQAITRAANDEQIDATTEILCGAALRQAEFVFNRMSRLQRQNAPVPLSILWMPEATFLRQSPRFEEIIGAAGLPAFWQEHGTPDVCANEPKVYGCRLRRPGARAQPRPASASAPVQNEQIPAG